jgi:CTP:molybdopterin cytidylyltransferase MocA
LPAESGLRIVGLVLAGGAGRRVGGPKALLRLGPLSFAAHAAALLERPGVERVVLVLGHEAARVELEAGLAARFGRVVNPDPGQGMLSSLLCGLDAAERLGAGAVLVHPVDHPLVAPQTVDRVVAALQAGARVAVPSWDGRRGHPAGFARSAWEALRAAPPEQGARAVLREHPGWVEHVAGDPGCLTGIDTPADLARLPR